MALQRPSTISRDWYNPLKGLTMSTIVAYEDTAERGQYADLQWLWRLMELTDVTVQAAIARRLSFVDTLDWEIRTMPNTDPVLAKEQTDLLQYAYNRISNLKEATKFLASSIFKGYAHLEKVGTGYANLISRLDPIPQWHWVRDGQHAAWRFNPQALSNCSDGEHVDRKTLCILESPALNRSIGRHYFAKQLAFADWDQALELSANQSIFVIGPPGTTEEKELEYLATAEKLASNLRGYLPNGADIKTVDLGARSRLPYFERVRYCDEQIVMAATGGLLTMLTQPGSGTLAGGAHAEGLMALARSDAQRLTEVYQRDLDAYWLSEFFPQKPHAAYFSFETPQKEDVASLLEAVANLNWAGYRVDQAQLEEKTGLKLTPVVPPA